MKTVTDTATAHWAVVYSVNSISPRARRWYHIARIANVDGKWFELYWFEFKPAQGWEMTAGTRGSNLAAIRAAASAAGLDLIAGVFHDAPSPHHGSELVREGRHIVGEVA
jgi:hypothetical protein